MSTRLALPAIYSVREFVEVGGLMSYGSSTIEQFHLDRRLYRARAQGREAGRPANPARQQIRVRHQSARRRRALGIDIPATLLARADEVIE